MRACREQTSQTNLRDGNGSVRGTERVGRKGAKWVIGSAWAGGGLGGRGGLAGGVGAHAPGIVQAVDEAGALQEFGGGFYQFFDTVAQAWRRQRGGLAGGGRGRGAARAARLCGGRRRRARRSRPTFWARGAGLDYCHGHISIVFFSVEVEYWKVDLRCSVYGQEMAHPVGLPRCHVGFGRVATSRRP